MTDSYEKLRFTVKPLLEQSIALVVEESGLVRYRAIENFYREANLDF